MEKPELASDPRFATNTERTENETALKKALEKILKTNNAPHWIEKIRNIGVPVAPLLNVAEAMTLPQTQARTMLIEAGGIKMLGNPIKISGYPDPAVRKGAPSLNEHGDRLRKEFAAKERT